MMYFCQPQEGTIREQEGFCAREIPLPIDKLNVAEITLTKRYPDGGYVRNNLSEMIVHILEGSVSFTTDGNTREFGVGSTLLVRIGQRYCWEPKGSVRFLSVSTPPWTPEQHKRVP